MGITFDRWCSLLMHNRFQIVPAYWYRAGAVTLASGMNSLLSAVESWRYARQIETTELVADPVFILGHWRSGTTLLHELMALDYEQFAYPNTFQAMSPHTFLSAEKPMSRFMTGLMPNHRPMDNMPIDFHSPQEDEFAIALKSSQSYYMALSFPQAEQAYERYLTLQDLSPAELQRWQNTVRWFLQKLTLKYHRQLVLKSPPHTARIRYLLDLFPRAKFIHIHRHPYDVFRSMRHYYLTAGWLTYLQRPQLEVLDESILRRYRLLYDAYFEQRHLIPADQFYEVSFADLAHDPLGQVRAIYEALKLPYSPNLDTKLKHYTNARRGYRKNVYSSLNPSMKQKIDREWQRSFDAWNYTT